MRELPGTRKGLALKSAEDVRSCCEYDLGCPLGEAEELGAPKGEAEQRLENFLQKKRYLGCSEAAQASLF